MNWVDLSRRFRWLVKCGIFTVSKSCGGYIILHALVMLPVGYKIRQSILEISYFKGVNM